MRLGTDVVSGTGHYAGATGSAMWLLRGATGPETSYLFQKAGKELLRAGVAADPSDPERIGPNGDLGYLLDVANFGDNTRQFTSLEKISTDGTNLVFMTGNINLPATAFASAASPILPISSTNGAGRPEYSFTPIVVAAGQQVFIDPDVAIGYEYKVRYGDPFFASVLLPTGVGDDEYTIEYLNGSTIEIVTVHSGTWFNFPAMGVAAFKVTGIEVSAGLDPTNPNAFVTGLTLVGAGVFAGTMTPLTAAVPEAETYALMLVGLCLVAVASRRRLAR